MNNEYKMIVFLQSVDILIIYKKVQKCWINFTYICTKITR